MSVLGRGSELQDQLRQFTQQDMLGTSLRVSLGLLGPIGVITGEFLTQFVPQQRVDRLADFIQKLAERFDGLEESFRQRLTEPGYGALAEAATVAAVQTPSDERRRDLVALLRHGLSKVDAELQDEHALLRLLQDLSDVELLVLAYYRLARHASYGDPAPDLFRERHPAIFDALPPTFGSSPDEERRWMMYEHYEDRLLRLGLLKQTASEARSRDLEITGMGAALIEAIDREPEGTKPD